VGAPSGEAIDQIDETLADRSARISNPEAHSYTLDLLRDPNEAAKKFGSEVIEFTVAATTETASDTEGELADLIYAALVFARSKHQPIELGNVLQILVERNQASEQQPAS
jgi:phosphoribosyl-ATP pyrophosphohydrolase